MSSVYNSLAKTSASVGSKKPSLSVLSKKTKDSSGGSTFVISANPEKWSISPQVVSFTQEFVGTLEDWSKGVGIEKHIDKNSIKFFQDINPSSGAAFGNLREALLVEFDIDAHSNNAPIPLGVTIAGIEGKQVHAGAPNKFAVIIPASCQQCPPVNKHLFTTGEVKATGTRLAMASLTREAIEKDHMEVSAFPENIKMPDGTTRQVRMVIPREATLLGNAFEAIKRDGYEDRLVALYGEDGAKQLLAKPDRCTEDISGDLIKFLLEEAKGSKLTRVNLYGMKMRIDPTLVDWQNVVKDPRIGDSSDAAIHQFKMKTVHSASVNCTIKFYMPHQLGLEEVEPKQ